MWKVELLGLDEGIAGMLPEFLDGPDLAIQVENRHVYLKGSRFDGCSSHGEVKQLAERDILPALNGALSLSGLPSARPLTVGAVSKRLDDGSEQMELQVPIQMTIRAFGMLKITRDGEPVDEKSQIAKLMAFAKESAAARRVLALLGHTGEPSLVDLYKIMEIIEEDFGKTKSLATLWSSEAERKRFTGSVNRPDVSGDAARHAVATGGPPAKPMSPEESRRVILQLVKRWVSQRLTQPS